jgi:hypothetical protein
LENSPGKKLKDLPILSNKPGTVVYDSYAEGISMRITA